MQNNFFLANNALPNESRIVVKKEGILCCLHAVEEYGNLTVAREKEDGDSWLAKEAPSPAIHGLEGMRRWYPTVWFPQFLKLKT